MYKPGDYIRLQVVEMSSEKIKVSRKSLMENRFPECLSRYMPNGEYVGTVLGRRVCSVRRRPLKVPTR